MSDAANIIANLDPDERAELLRALTAGDKPGKTKAGTRSRTKTKPKPKKPGRAVQSAMEPPTIYPLAKPWANKTRPEQLIPDLPDPAGIGEKAWQICARLKITEGLYAGEAFGNVAAPWQEKFVRTIFGHTDRQGKRLLRRAVLKTARKSGKTDLASRLALTECLLGTEQRGQVLCLAAQRDQAKLLLKNVGAMISADQHLSSRFEQKLYQNVIHDKVTDTEITALSNEAGQIVGRGGSFVVTDELHLLGTAGERATDLVHSLESGMLAREQPMMVSITTAPQRKAAGIYTEIMEHARGVFAGEINDPRTLAVLYELLEDDDPADSSTWWRANPGLGTTLKLEALNAEWSKAQSRGAEAVHEFLSQNLNIEPKNRDRQSAWIKTELWESGRDKAITLEHIEKHAEHIVVGIDAGGAMDLTSVCVLGSFDNMKTYKIWWRNFLSRDGYDEQKSRGPFADFIRDDLTIVYHVGDDVNALISLIERLYRGGNSRLRAVGADAYGLKAAAHRIEEITGKQIIAVPQGWRLSPYVQAFDRRFRSGSLKHGAGPCVDWQFSNAELLEKVEVVSITKPGGIIDSPLKIDAVIAALCAFAVAEEELPNQLPYDVGFWIG